MNRRFLQRCSLVFILLACLTAISTRVLAADRVIYATGFEDQAEYAADGTISWQWGAPDPVGKPAGPAACNGGLKCWGTSLSQVTTGTGNIVSPDIAIPALAPGQVARLSFHAYIDVAVMASNSGYGDIYISKDGQQTWTKLAHLLEKMAGGWQRYDFDISEFAGSTVNLRFLAFMSSYAPDQGLYIDDVAITIVDVPSPSKKFTLTAWEDPASSASCPWVFTWDGSDFVRDNDIYSVARYPEGKQRDFYLLQKPLVAQAGQYNLEVRELEAEDSWTDMVGLRTIDHAADVAVAPDSKGNLVAFRPAGLLAPVSAVSNSGANVLALVGTRNDSGFPAYGDDYLDLNFGTPDTSSGARLVLRMKGFLLGQGADKPYSGPPAIAVQMQDKSGAWQEVGRLNPRFDWSLGGFDLAPYILDPAASLKVRLVSISHATKYHEIDQVGLSVGPQPTTLVSEPALKSASYAGADVLARLSSADNQYVQMGTGNKFSFAFAAAPLPTGQTRDFLLVSEGYYIPHGDTYFVYTWDGTKWAQRDAVSFTTPTNVFSTKVFDLSSYLPDPQGEYKVRIWQDYCYETAGIDFVGMNVDTLVGALATAQDLRNAADITASVTQQGDSSTFSYPYGQPNSSGVRPRDRWTEFSWTGLPFHVPPEVPTGQLASLGGNIRWGYYSPTADLQVGFDIQVWTGANATGSVVWSPATFTQATKVIRYTGTPLVPGRTYYLRIRLYDGVAWGAWVETAFVAPKRDGILVSAGSTPSLADAFKALQIAVGAAEATDADLDTGDVAPVDPLTGLSVGDGKIDVFDVIAIMRRSVGL
jgi:hypothetical protein